MLISSGWLVAALVSVGLVALLAYVWILRRLLRHCTKAREELKAQVLEWNRRLEERVGQRASELEAVAHQLQNAYLETVTALVEAMAAKDTYLRVHSHRVAQFAKGIAEEMGLSKERIRRLVQGCELHDLGKIAVPDQILTKPRSLTPEEYEIVKQHPVWGARILGPLTFLKDITDMVHQEHERWDGNGYPQGLKGEQILLEARIIAVADALDAMTSGRPYRSRLPLQEAAEELQRCAGTQFDSQVVEAALKAIRFEKLTAGS